MIRLFEQLAETQEVQDGGWDHDDEINKTCLFDFVGQLVRSSWIDENGELDGTQTVWKNGRLAQVMNYKHNQFDGLQLTFCDNQINKTNSFNYKNGVLIGRVSETECQEYLRKRIAYDRPLYGPNDELLNLE